MKKILEGLLGHKKPSRREIRSVLKKTQKRRTICYVLLTCSEPKEDGKVEVNMRYEGEKWLANYLVQSAQKVLEGEANDGGLA